MSQATDMLAAYIDAEQKVLSGQTFYWGDKRWSLADLAEIRKGRAEWQQKVNAEAAAAAGNPGGARVALADFGCDR